MIIEATESTGVRFIKRTKVILVFTFSTISDVFGYQSIIVFVKLWFLGIRGIRDMRDKDLMRGLTGYRFLELRRIRPRKRYLNRLKVMKIPISLTLTSVLDLDSNMNRSNHLKLATALTEFCDNIDFWG